MLGKFQSVHTAKQCNSDVAAAIYPLLPLLAGDVQTGESSNAIWNAVFWRELVPLYIVTLFFLTFVVTSSVTKMTARKYLEPSGVQVRVEICMLVHYRKEWGLKIFCCFV